MAKYTLRMDYETEITVNGEYELVFFGGHGRRYFSAEWLGEKGAAAGRLDFSFDGNPGDPAASMDLARNDNAFALTTRLGRVSVQVSCLPPGGRILLRCY